MERDEIWVIYSDHLSSFITLTRCSTVIELTYQSKGYRLDTVVVLSIELTIKTID
jgi:hypothetical protein